MDVGILNSRKHHIHRRKIVTFERCQQMKIHSVHVQNVDRSDTAEGFQNGTYLKNIPRTLLN